MENSGINTGLSLGNASIGRKFSIRKFEFVLFSANIISFFLGIIYLTNPQSSWFWNAYGVILILTLFSNLMLIYKGVRNRALEYLYLICSMACMIGLPLINTVKSMSLQKSTSLNILGYAFLFLLFGLGSVIAFLGLVSRRKSSFSIIQEVDTRDIPMVFSPVKKLIRFLMLLLSYLFIISGIFFSFKVLFRYSIGTVEALIPEYSVFAGFVFLSAAIFAVRLHRKRRKTVYHRVLLALGLVLFIACMIPLISIPYALNDAEKNFSKAFGTGWKNGISLEDNKEFMSTPFSIPAYFTGTPSKEYTVKENVLFYQGTQGVDKGIKLYFDVYMPPKTQKPLPGKNSTLIRIHGGAWIAGDKGAENMTQVNKYFASKGYVVFDIQYGLSTAGKFDMQGLKVPENVKGKFSVDDMVRHIGLFTKYLANHNNEYGANLDSVFISGGSAGGHLATAAALALNSGKYQDTLDSRLKIKGIIPLYPANGLAKDGDIKGSNELMDPVLLVEKNSPPCLIYQGTRDGLVNPKISQTLKDAYIQKGNEKSTVLWMPFGSHASDLYFSGYYNQIFMYYMERFMYIYR